MFKKLLIISLVFVSFSQALYSQIPGLTFTNKKDQEDIYLKTKTVWITATPFFLVEKKFSPDQGATYLKVGMLGGNLKPYVQEDSIAYRNLKNYKLTRVFGLAQMGVIAPLLAYKHFTTEPGTVSTGNEDIDESVVLEEETGYLTAAIIVFCTGTLTYHVFSKNYLFRSLDRYNYLLGNNIDMEAVAFNMNMTIDPRTQTPQLSLVWTF
ncbi:MAG: hypothetical protein JEY96_07275 [Bacteroidales bacterium]|nr:hypothetical protein [Bacteroidales bacterium]